MLSATAVGADAEAAASEAFDMVALAAQALLAQFESLAPRLAIDSSSSASASTAASAHLTSLETRAQISLAAAGSTLARGDMIFSLISL
jgi:hypothetical protein